jgi:hypothetical protein
VPLRSHSVPSLEQEIFALLTVYQAVIRMADHVATAATPELSVQRVSLAERVNISPNSAKRLKDRHRKTFSKYQFQLDRHLRTAQAYMQDFTRALHDKGRHPRPLHECGGIHRYLRRSCAGDGGESRGLLRALVVSSDKIVGSSETVRTTDNLREAAIALRHDGASPLNTFTCLRR